METLKAEISQLKANFQRETDTREKLIIKENFLKKELKLVSMVRGEFKTKALFNPQQLHKISGIKLQPVCLNYIPFIKGAYNILTGKGGSGKSAVALKSMIVYLKVNKEENGVAFFSEDAKEDIKERIEIICLDVGANFQDITSRIFFMTVESDDRIKWVKKSRDEYQIRNDYVDSFIEFCENNKVGFIILDPLKRFHSLSENSNDDMDILVRDIFTSMAVKINAVLLVLHHSAKSGEGASSRGASTITDSARLGWHIGRYYLQDKETKELILDPERANKIKLSCIKDNNGLERKCFVRNEQDGSIPNPLSRLKSGNMPQVTKYQMPEQTTNSAEMPEIF